MCSGSSLARIRRPRRFRACANDQPNEARNADQNVQVPEFASLRNDSQTPPVVLSNRMGHHDDHFTQLRGDFEGPDVPDCGLRSNAEKPPKRRHHQEDRPRPAVDQPVILGVTDNLEPDQVPPFMSLGPASSQNHDTGRSIGM